MVFNKVNPKELRVLTFEYILLQMARWYSEEQKLKTVGEFNKGNDLTSSKILLYPFFISTSNGHSRDLLKLLGDFFPFEEGPTSINILEIMEESDTKLKYFSTDYLKPSYGLEIKNYEDPTKSLAEVFTDIENYIMNSTISISDSSSTPEPFSKIEVEQDKNAGSHSAISKAIESSITAMKKYSDNQFVLFKPTDLTVLGKFYDSYTNGLRKGDFKAMDIEDIITDRRPY